LTNLPRLSSGVVKLSHRYYLIDTYKVTSLDRFQGLFFTDRVDGRWAVSQLVAGGRREDSRS
jgi:hypothetical protein